MVADPAAGQTPSLVGKEIASGRYVLEAELGQGASGVVYRALDRMDERQVALNLLSVRRSRSGQLLRFKPTRRTKQEIAERREYGGAGGGEQGLGWGAESWSPEKRALGSLISCALSLSLTELRGRQEPIDRSRE